MAPLRHPLRRAGDSASPSRTRIEQQAQGGQSTVELLNRITELQREVRALRGLVETQGFKIEELEKRARDQYLDLDARIARIEGGGQAGTGASLMDSEATPPLVAVTT